MFYKRNFLTFIGLVYVALGCLRVRARQTEAAGDLPDVLQAEFPHVHRPGLRRPRLSACTCSTDRGRRRPTRCSTSGISSRSSAWSTSPSVVCVYVLDRPRPQETYPMFYKRNFLTFIGLVYVALGCLRVRARQTKVRQEIEAQEREISKRRSKVQDKMRALEEARHKVV